MPKPENRDLPTTRTPPSGGISNEEFDRGDGKAREPPPHPKTSGAPAEKEDTSRGTAANRNREGPRQAGTTPRPTDKPIS
jgi:hypothetical protein